jgi:hypothetical protein
MIKMVVLKGKLFCKTAGAHMNISNVTSENIEAAYNLPCTHCIQPAMLESYIISTQHFKSIEAFKLTWGFVLSYTAGLVIS